VAFTYSATTNRIAGYTYDAAGNVTNDTYNAYQWDAEGRLAAVTRSGSLVSLNTYNALGQRVEDVTQTSTTDEAYGAGGNLLVRYTGDSNSRSFVPFNGGVLAEYYCGGTVFDHPDGIGSATTSTDCTGNTVNEKLFYPFGESWTGAAIPNLGAHQTFAQLPDYDAETDQYNTANRHYSPSGRWMSPDPFNASVLQIINPQRWNMYAYSLNNPTTLFDPTGLSAIAVNFKNEVPIGGHEGFVSIHDDGRAEYARFGPVGGGEASGPGEVDVVRLSRVPMGKDGTPTYYGYQQLARELGLYELQDPSTVRMNFFITSELDTELADAWIQRIKEASDRGRAPWYFFNSQNCATFTIAGLIQGGAISPNQKISIMPNHLFDLLSLISTEDESQGQRTPTPHVSTKIIPCNGPACPEGPEG
jgi:RHS repeat-associated protein